MGGSAFGPDDGGRRGGDRAAAARRKVWRTSGPQRLFIIDQYEMGFEIDPEGGGSHLRVWIDYDLPPAGPGRWLGAILAPAYARWCVNRMLSDGRVRFRPGRPGPRRPARAA
jgi:hypothetical protein